MTMLERHLLHLVICGPAWMASTPNPFKRSKAGSVNATVAPLLAISRALSVSIGDLFAA